MWTKVLFTKLEEPKILNALIEFTFIQWLGYNDDITIVKSSVVFNIAQHLVHN